jgi:hypothetical protein
MGCNYRGVLGLIVGFIGLFDIARDYILQFTIGHTRSSQPAVTSIGVA